mgnify:CR=1 FL=1
MGDKEKEIKKLKEDNFDLENTVDRLEDKCFDLEKEIEETEEPLELETMVGQEKLDFLLENIDNIKMEDLEKLI